MSKFKSFVDGIRFIWSDTAMQLYGSLFAIFFLGFLVLLVYAYIAKKFDW